MPNRKDALAALCAVQSKPVTKSEPTAPSVPSSSGGCASPVYTGRVRDRQRAAIENPASKQETLYEQEVRLYGKYWADIYRDQRDAKTKEERIAAEAARVKAARAIDDQRRTEDAAERERRAKELQEQNLRIATENLIKADIRSSLADATAPEVEAVLALVREWKMTRQSFAYPIALKTVREAASK